MKRIGIAVAVAATLSGCASVAIESGEARIVPGTVSAEPAGLNYRITALTQAGGNRERVHTYATDCSAGHGDIFPAGRGGLVENTLLNGNTPKDKMFTQLCNEGMPLAQAMDDKVTPEQRAARMQEMYQYMLDNAWRPVMVQTCARGGSGCTFAFAAGELHVYKPSLKVQER